MENKEHTIKLLLDKIYSLQEENIKLKQEQTLVDRELIKAYAKGLDNHIDSVGKKIADLGNMGNPNKETPVGSYMNHETGKLEFTKSEFEDITHMFKRIEKEQQPFINSVKKNKPIVILNIDNKKTNKTKQALLMLDKNDKEQLSQLPDEIKKIDRYNILELTGNLGFSFAGYGSHALDENLPKFCISGEQRISFASDSPFETITLISIDLSKKPFQDPQAMTDFEYLDNSEVTNPEKRNSYPERFNEELKTLEKENIIVVIKRYYDDKILYNFCCANVEKSLPVIELYVKENDISKIHYQINTYMTHVEFGSDVFEFAKNSEISKVYTNKKALGELLINYGNRVIFEKLLFDKDLFSSNTQPKD